MTIHMRRFYSPNSLLTRVASSTQLIQRLDLLVFSLKLETNLATGAVRAAINRVNVCRTAYI